MHYRRHVDHFAKFQVDASAKRNKNSFIKIWHQIITRWKFSRIQIKYDNEKTHTFSINVWFFIFHYSLFVQYRLTWMRHMSGNKWDNKTHAIGNQLIFAITKVTTYIVQVHRKQTHTHIHINPIPNPNLAVIWNYKRHG